MRTHLLTGIVPTGCPGICLSTFPRAHLPSSLLPHLPASVSDAHRLDEISRPRLRIAAGNKEFQGISMYII